MRSLYSLAAIAALSTVATAQLSISSTFAGGNGGGPEWTNQFDATVLAASGIDVTGLNLHISSAAGTTGTVDIYVVPGGTYVGNEINAAYWPATPTISSDPFTSNGLNVPTPVTFSSVLPLAPGANAIGIHYRGVGMAYTNGTGVPGNQQVANADIQLDLGSSTTGLFAGSRFNPRVCNIEIFYVPSGGGTLASATKSGTGCGGSTLSNTFYEGFGASNPFDLANTSFDLAYANGEYTVTPGGTTPINPPAGTNPLALGDDQTVQVPLGFTMDSPAGQITDIYVCSNGYISFEATTIADFSPSVGELLGRFAVICPLWRDLNPTAGGTIDAETAANGDFEVTFTNVPAFGTTNSNNFQVAFSANGDIEVRYGQIDGTGPLVGLSGGNGSADPGGIDISASASFNIAASTTVAPDFDINPGARPVIGTTADVTFVGEGSGAVTAMNYGLPFLSGPIPLGFIGAAGCVGYVDAFFSAPGNSLPIPNNSGLVGITLSVQAVSGFGGYSTNIDVATSSQIDWFIGDV